MDYLIDGHNLIGQLPDIDLADPNDEIKLVWKLKSWAAADRRRKVHVYFDGGLPGGRKVNMSSSKVKVIFAGSGRIADELLILHIKKVKDPAGTTLITNDREIISPARRKRLRFISATDFAQQISEDKIQRQILIEQDEADDPEVNNEDMQIWLNAFGDVGESKIRPYQKKKPPPPPPKERKPLPKRTVDELKEAGGLRDDEMAEWLMMFGDEPETQPEPPTSRKKTPSPKKRRTPTITPRSADSLKASGAKLTDDEVDTWLDIFTEPND